MLYEGLTLKEWFNFNTYSDSMVKSLSVCVCVLLIAVQASLHGNTFAISGTSEEKREWALNPLSQWAL